MKILQFFSFCNKRVILNCHFSGSFGDGVWGFHCFMFWGSVVVSLGGRGCFSVVVFLRWFFLGGVFLGNPAKQEEPQEETAFVPSAVPSAVGLLVQI